MEKRKKLVLPALALSALLTVSGCGGAPEQSCPACTVQPAACGMHCDSWTTGEVAAAGVGVTGGLLAFFGAGALIAQRKKELIYTSNMNL